MMYELTTRTFVRIVPNMTQYITYLRVSTKHQGINGLGIEAQRNTIASFAQNGEIVAEYVEVESGKKTDRPQLNAALAHAKKIKATLLIAKLDRLARDVYFVSKLLKEKVEFVAADMPYANKMTIQLMAVMAEWERDQASIRTKAALAAAKARGVKLGCPDHATLSAACTAAAKRRNAVAIEIINAMRSSGSTLVEIAQALQAKGVKTGRGKSNWSATQVRRLVEV